MRKNMAPQLSSEREAIANAACDVAGRKRPVSMEIPEEDRVYLFACPDDGGGKFRVGDLSSRLDRAEIPHGVNWDRKSGHFGLRFVPRAFALPPEVKPFTSEVARQGWKDWRRAEEEMAVVTASAAAIAARGEHIDFGSAEYAVGSEKPRRQAGRSDERN